jgi:hypothetical protein
MIRIRMLTAMPWTMMYRFCQEVGSLRTLCLFIYTLLAILALDLIGYAAVGGWDTFWSNDMWPFLCLQMLIPIFAFFVLLLVSMSLFLILKIIVNRQRSSRVKTLGLILDRFSYSIYFITIFEFFVSEFHTLHLIWLKLLNFESLIKK